MPKSSCARSDVRATERLVRVSNGRARFERTRDAGVLDENAVFERDPEKGPEASQHTRLGVSG